jgi:hypothetical protein
VLKVFGSHAAVLLLSGDDAVDLRFSRKHFLPFGALEEHFSLNQVAKHLQPSLGHLKLVQRRCVSASLLADDALNLGKHDVATVYGGGNIIVLQLSATRGTTI